jgi:hypothetical protein
MAFGDVKGTFEAGNSSPGTGFAATGSIAVAVGDLIVVALGGRNAVVPTWTDNLGGGYTALNGGVGTAGRPVYAAFKYVSSADTLTSVSFTQTSDTGDKALCVAVFEGPFDASPLDTNPAVLADSTSPLTSNLTGTLAQADELVVGYVGQGNGTADGGYGSSGSFTVAVDESTGTGSNTGSCAIFKAVVAATTSIAAAVTGAAQGGSVGVASFKKGATNITASGTPDAQSATIDGAAEAFIEATGDLAAQAASIDGVAEAIPATATGDLDAQAATIDGAAEAFIEASGTPDAQAASIDGAAEAFIEATGDLVAQAASIDGAAEAFIAAVGDLAAQAASIDGVGEAFIAAVGDLAAQAASIDGVADTGESDDPDPGEGAISEFAISEWKVSDLPIILLEGDLLAQAASIDGAVSVLVEATGDLEAAVAQIDGSAEAFIDAAGALLAASAQLDGSVSVIVEATGDLVVPGLADIAGSVSAIIEVTGDVAASSAQIDGSVTIGLSVSGNLQAQAPTISGSVTVEKFRRNMTLMYVNAGG